MNTPTQFSELHYKYLSQEGYYLIPISYNGDALSPSWRDASLFDSYIKTQLYGIMPSESKLIIDITSTTFTTLESWERFIYNNPELSEFQERLMRLDSWCNIKKPVSSINSGYYVYFELGSVDSQKIPLTHPNYPGLKFITYRQDYSICGGQQLSHGYYTMNLLFTMGKITSLESWGDQLPYPDYKERSQTPKKSKQPILSKPLDLQIEFIT